MSLCIAVWYKEVIVCEVFLEQQLVEEPTVGAFESVYGCKSRTLLIWNQMGEHKCLG